MDHGHVPKKGKSGQLHILPKHKDYQDVNNFWGRRKLTEVTSYEGV